MKIYSAIRSIFGFAIRFVSIVLKALASVFIDRRHQTTAPIIASKYDRSIAVSRHRARAFIENARRHDLYGSGYFGGRCTA